ncbi:MAG: flagellar biosynthetic protein FliO [Shewanella sp.]|uniref:flagellar biosynthetic protein FliO n=1 Tax=Shewanella sp. SNU WT4 TaxID=2590015 RepID=UPI0011263378|nr:flagellar biosynthetic protein FliO [Shewanella sp. SNU WT4]QDF67678.1 flagellar biosynthetic protein FliO [Shewanella sp. SNU WT4]
MSGLIALASNASDTATKVAGDGASNVASNVANNVTSSAATGISQAGVASADPTSIATMASMAGGLVVVLVVIFVLAWLVRRLNLVPGQHGLIKTIAVTPLGQKEKLVLMELDGQQYLLGVTAHNISLLDKLAEPINHTPINFAERLKQVKQAKQGAGSVHVRREDPAL